MVERRRFFLRNQEVDENIDSFLTELRNLATKAWIKRRILRVEYNVNIFDCDAAENVLRVKRHILNVSNKIY